MIVRIDEIAVERPDQVAPAIEAALAARLDPELARTVAAQVGAALVARLEDAE